MSVAGLLDLTRTPQYPMNVEAKEKWIIALRSGAYTQGVRFLREGNKFCVLGVLMDLISTKNWLPAKTTFSISKKVMQIDGRIGQLSLDVQRAAHISRDDMVRLADMSDRGMSFPEIADWIEENH